MIRKIVSIGLQIVGALTLVGLVLLGLGTVVSTRSSAYALAGSSTPAPMAHRNLQNFGGDVDGLVVDEPAAPVAAERSRRDEAKKAKGGPLGGMGGGAGHGVTKSLAAPAAPPPPEVAAAPKDADKAEGANAEAPAAPSREWFPESFLFEPLVVTDAHGEAELQARVPDRLTTWRVLALAHSRTGQQAGTVASFLGTLPAYVEPVLPGFLIAGDDIRLPVQLVNTTQASIRAPFSVQAKGAQLSTAGGMVEVPATGSKVEYVGLKAARPGDVTLKAALGSTDAVVKSFPVRPSGKPVDQSFGGTLAAPRTLTIAAPEKADPESARVRLVVYPGALALLRSELGAASSRWGPDADAYALELAGKAPSLLSALGEKADKEALRQVTLVAGQRALVWGRSADLNTAVLFAEAALAHPDNAVLHRLGERLEGTLASSQRPDGTFAGQDGWTVQRLLVTTARAVQALGADASDPRAAKRVQAAQLRAEGAFERNLKLVDDGYTAAALLASGAVRGSLGDGLRERVRKAVTTLPDGSRVLMPEKEIVRPDGLPPSPSEATALAVLALEGDKEAPWRADLGSYLLGQYRPEIGWGDGQTNLACLRAVLALFKDPLPPKVVVTLEMDGKTVTDGTLQGERLKDTLALETGVEGAAGKHTWTVKADPPLPGLGYALTLRTWVPWEREEAQGGFELSLKVGSPLRVGQAAPVDVAAAAPGGVVTRIRQALPAGVQVDRPSLEKLRSDGAIIGFEVGDGEVTLDLRPREANEPFTARYRVIPTLAGTLHAAASTISPVNQPELAYELPPVVWKVE